MPFLSNDIRNRLRLDPNLGAGNFLHHALAVSLQNDLPLVFSATPFIVPGGGSRSELSITELASIARQYSAWYLRRGVGPTDPVALYFEDSLQCLIQYLAVTAIGAVPVLTNGMMDTAVAARHFERVGVVGAMTDHARLATLGAHLDVGRLKFIDCLEEVAGVHAIPLPSWYPFKHNNDDPVMITHSSGTTGVPKAVVLQHGGWFHGVRQLLGLDLAQGASRYLSALPVSHNASIAYAMHAILNGAAFMCIPSLDIQALAREIADFRPATVLAFSHSFVRLAELDRSGFDFSSVTTWINSGDAAHEPHIRRLVANGYHYRGTERVVGSQFVDGFGASELGHSSLRVIHTPYTSNYDRCIGVPQSWVDVAVFDADGRRVPTGVIGQLGVRSPSVTPGYWNDSLLTYRSRLHGYWLTGDLVYRGADGCYYHVDRTSDIVRTARGPLYSLQTEESVLQAHGHQIADCTVVGVAAVDGGVEEAVLLAIPIPGTAIDVSELLSTINRAQDSLGRPRLARVQSSRWSDIPLGLTGKVLKRALRKRLAPFGNQIGS
ncbi:Long-chain-fatty-acid--CoA ligase [Nitrospira japonica]|uniref:Long-chain-fatty-acid--CoA ligase n=1 Tax=Nitrospira japonica TaxID=1325564 RepID=A0A1W1IAY5_9BACT|nr:class I adenylate-forming enzyme family protein [Nitrospira japonica]SLM49933.1 Long-chain-fatty-acid--CoA ligase [Nitrospira japonica]